MEECGGMDGLVDKTWDFKGHFWPWSLQNPSSMFLVKPWSLPVPNPIFFLCQIQPKRGEKYLCHIFSRELGHLFRKMVLWLYLK